MTVGFLVLVDYIQMIQKLLYTTHTKRGTAHHFLTDGPEKTPCYEK